MTLIYSLEPIESKKLKSYIKIKLANGYIRHWKFTMKIFILFVIKFDGSFWIYIYYQGIND